jgi:hypothetical protein
VPAVFVVENGRHSLPYKSKNSSSIGMRRGVRGLGVVVLLCSLPVSVIGQTMEFRCVARTNTTFGASRTDDVPDWWCRWCGTFKEAAVGMAVLGSLAMIAADVGRNHPDQSSVVSDASWKRPGQAAPALGSASRLTGRINPPVPAPVSSP